MHHPFSSQPIISLKLGNFLSFKKLPGKFIRSRPSHILSQMRSKDTGAICVPIGFENGQLSDREMTAMTMRWAARSPRSERGHQTLASEVKDEIQIPEQTGNLSSTCATLHWKFTEPRPFSCTMLCVKRPHPDH